MTQTDTKEMIAGIELDRLVAQACGIHFSIKDSSVEEYVQRLDDEYGAVYFEPSRDANDTLHAMDCLRKKIGAEFTIYLIDTGLWKIEIPSVKNWPTAAADTFPLAVSLAIAQVGI